MVSRLVADSGAIDVTAVLCESGVQGTVGAVGHCDVDAGGARLRRTVEVSGVSGLMMSFGLVPLPTSNINDSYEPEP